MKIIRVTYTTKADYAPQNQANIQTVMNDLRQVNRSGLLYHVCLNPDAKTFVHTAFFNSEEDEKVLQGLASFLDFQSQLKASGPEAPPKQELLTLVGSSKDIL
jgi:hypothetical protein